MKRVVIRVVWDKKNAMWAIKQGQTTVSLIPKKDTAVKSARVLAKTYPLSQLMVHAKDGAFQQEYTYPRSSDPRSSPG